jgi:hypothetical protein
MGKGTGEEMTQDEIIEMARQAGLVFDAKNPELSVYPPALEAFAKLVAAKQREESAFFIEELDERGFKELAGLIRARGES